LGLSAKSTPGKNAGYMSTRIATIPLDPRRSVWRIGVLPILRTWRLISEDSFGSMCVISHFPQELARTIRNIRVTSSSVIRGAARQEEKRHIGGMLEPFLTADLNSGQDFLNYSPKGAADARNNVSGTRVEPGKRRMIRVPRPMCLSLS
jgi:hypothetical protein